MDGGETVSASFLPLSALSTAEQCCAGQVRGVTTSLFVYLLLEVDVALWVDETWSEETYCSSLLSSLCSVV